MQNNPQNPPDAVLSPSEAADPLRRRLFWLALAVLALYAAGVGPHWRFQRDGVLYVGLGRSLAETGTYSFNGEPHRLALPGFPAMLALVFRVCGESFPAMNALVAVFAIGALAMVWLVYRQLPMTDRQAASCMALCGLSRTIFYYANQIITDVPFLFFAMVALYCGARMVRAAGRDFWGWCAGAGLAAAAASTIRPVGPALVVALVAAVWLRRDVRPNLRRSVPRSLAASAILVVPAAVFLLLWSMRNAGIETTGPPGYVGAFVTRRGLAAVARDALVRVPLLLDSTSDAILGKDLGWFVDAVLLAALGVGFGASLRRGDAWLCIYAAVYLGGVLLGKPGARYLVGVLPLLYYWLVLGVGCAVYWVTEGRRPATAARLWRIGRVAVALVVAINVARIGKVIYEAHAPSDHVVIEHDGIDDYSALMDYIGSEDGCCRVVYAYEGRMIHYFTRVRTLPYQKKWPTLGGLPWVVERMRRAGVDCVVREAKDGDAGREKGDVLGSLQRARPEAFTREKTFGRLTLWRVDLDKLGGEEP